MLRYLVTALPLLLVVAGCRWDGDVRVHSYWGTTIDRPVAGSVYDWAADSVPADLSQDESIAAAIHGYMERELAAMGFVKNLGDRTPDMLVSVSVGRGLQPSPSGPEQRALLSVRVYRTTGGHLIYSASADALIEPSLPPEERRARLERAICELMRPLSPVKS